MISRKQPFYLFLISIFFSKILVAQQEQSLHFVRNIWQANLTNPALSTDKKVQIILPSVYYSLNSPDFTLQNFLKPDANGTLKVNDVVKNRLSPQNRINGYVQVQTLGVAVQAGEDLTLSLYHGVSGNPNLNLNKDLIKLTVEGNSQYLGKTVNLSSTANGSFYSEIGLGAAYKIQEHFSIGGRVKMLNGVAGLFTEKNKLNISFDPSNYNLSFDNDFNVKTYSLSKFSGIRTINDLVSFNFGKNKGFSFDLGATANLGNLNFSASVLDLGSSIKWKDDGKGYNSTGNYKYVGLNTNDVFNLDSFNVTGFKDTLKKVLGFNETINPEYIQKLPTKIYLSGIYKLNDQWDLGVLLYSETGGNANSHLGVSVNATMKIFEFLSAGGTVGLRNGSFTNLGLQAVIKLGPVQLYGVTDNIISAIRPFNSKSANGRVGLNVAF